MAERRPAAVSRNRDVPRAGSLAVRLARLGDQRRSGVLRVPGPHGGEIFLTEGRIAVAEAAEIPPAELLLWQAVDGGDGVPGDRDELRKAAREDVAQLVALGAIPRHRLEAAVSAASADAISALAGLGGGPGGELPFRTGQIHWLGAVRPLDVAAVLAEVARRSAVLRQIADRVGPDSVIVRADELPAARIRLSAAQWDLLRVADGAPPVRSLAWAVRRGLFTTTLEAYALVRLGVLRLASGPAGGAAQAAAVRARPELSFLRTG